MDALQLIPQHEDASYIEADLALLAQVSPQSKLLQKYGTGNNSFNSKERDGYVLKELLHKVSIDEILANRKKSLVVTILPEKKETEVIHQVPTSKQEKKNYHHGKSFPASNGGKRTTK